MAQAPLDRSLARPTDAPPLAHEGAAGEPAEVAATRPEVPIAPPEDLPRHVAIIMDGNRRWARAHGKAELEGHAAGVEAIRGLLQHAVRRGVPMLTLYAFSRENWARSDDEVAGLFELLGQAIRDETDELRAQGVRVRLLGRLEELPDATRVVHRRRPRPHGRGHPAPAQHRLELRGSHGARRRVPAHRGLGHPAPTRSTSGRSARRSTRAACPTPTS